MLININMYYNILYINKYYLSYTMTQWKKNLEGNSLDWKHEAFLWGVELAVTK